MWREGAASEMADIEITQAEADALIGMEKRFVDYNDWTFPAPGQRIAIELMSADKRENFVLDVTRARIKLTKATYQNRARQAIVLMRLDLTLIVNVLRSVELTGDADPEARI